MSSLKVSNFERELNRILTWWESNMVDEENGGFIGRVDGYGNKFPIADKAVILNTRILWSFSAAANSGNILQIEIANRAFDYIKEFFLDKNHGGLYWMLEFDGKPKDVKKQIYAQAFGIYALTEYYLFSENKEALDIALELFDLIEKHSKDPKKGGYYEAFSADWQPIEEVRLSAKDANDVKTMNTHLHLLECYTNLHKCVQSNQVENALMDLILLYFEKFIDHNNGRLKLFFDENWNENMHHHSYGHEIESVWLLNEAAHALGDNSILTKIENITLKIANRVLNEGIDLSGAVFNEKSVNGFIDPMREWWVTAEGVIGFYDAYQKSNDVAFLKAADNAWEYIQNNLIDVENGEWFWSCNAFGIPTLSEDKAGPWKSCYHNSRLCMEMIKRLKD